MIYVSINNERVLDNGGQMVKRKYFSAQIMIIFVLAIVLVISGIVCIWDVVSGYEEMVYLHEDRAALLAGMHKSTVRLSVGGAMIALGAGMMFLEAYLSIRRTATYEKEARLLREKNAEMEKLNIQVQRLAHHQRLQTIGTLTSSIAHEFNNLLTPIMGYSMMALEKLPQEETEIYDGILEIYQTSRKAKDIISRLSDLSRKNTDETFRIVSIDELVHKTLEVAKPAKPKDVEIKLNLNCWEQRIRANEIQICQMILNLIINAFHAMGEEAGVLSISTSFDDENVQLQVADTGKGIKEEILPEIFAPFFTTKEAGKGTGLGLAIIAQIVEDHQGDIRVETKEGEGATFIVSLPRELDISKIEEP